MHANSLIVRSSEVINMMRQTFIVLIFIRPRTAVSTLSIFHKMNDLFSYEIDSFTPGIKDTEILECHGGSCSGPTYNKAILFYPYNAYILSSD